jgi:hypothetical protein
MIRLLLNFVPVEDVEIGVLGKRLDQFLVGEHLHQWGGHLELFE